MAAASASADEAPRLRLFPELAAAPAPPVASERPLRLDPGTVVRRPPHRFVLAVSELLLLEVGPWAFDRWVLKEEFAQNSWESVKTNFREGFVYDSDTFDTNQWQHPYHGNLFFNAARENGYSFWGSAPFALAGSLMWECCMENTRPSVNDLVNTTLGGITRGEIAHRVAAMIFDNRARGFTRFVRELAGTLWNPVAGFNRIVKGESFAVFENPPDRYPSRFWLRVDAGYRHIQTAAREPEKGFLAAQLVYGDPFDGKIDTPFAFFDVAFEASAPTGGQTLFSLLSERGVLVAWRLDDPSSPVSRHMVGFFMHYDYVNNESQVVGAQRFSLGLVSNYRLGPKVEAASDLALLAFPLEGVRTTDFTTPETGRSYDYAPGVGVRGSASLRVRGFDLLSAAYSVTWDRTVNGVSRGNRLQYFHGEARAPLTKRLSLGGGYSWFSRQTTYDRFAPERRTQSEWRAFLSLKLGELDAEGAPPPKPPTP